MAPNVMSLVGACTEKIPSIITSNTCYNLDMCMQDYVNSMLANVIKPYIKWGRFKTATTLSLLHDVM